jgi:transcriptional regulator with XRE-family HTH domain
MRLSAPQISAAMALAGMTQDELASLAGMARPSLNRILKEDVVAKEDTLRKIKLALESRGVEFIGNIGVQWAQHQVRTLAGRDGLKAFFDDVRSVARTTDEEIAICGFSEDYFEKKLGEYLDYHRKEMTAIGRFKMRCLIEEGDRNVGAADYCQYRWQPKKNFSNVPFYIYGDKAAIVATAAPEDPLIILIHNRTIARAYRRQFEAMWDASLEPAVKQ